MPLLQQSKNTNRRLALLWLLLVLAVVTVIRLRLLDMPLERDEGAFAYGGRLLLQGISPYAGDYDNALKLPGTCAAYAVTLALFGQTTAAIHLTVLLVTLASALLVFLLTRRMCGDAAGTIASATYAILAINPASFGLAAHATHFVVLPALAGIFLLQNLDERATSARIFFAGLLLGVSLVMKQTGAAFCLFGAAWLVYVELHSVQNNPRRLAIRLGWLALGGSLPLLLTCALIVWAGDWAQFWLWTVKFAGAHAAVITFQETLQTAAGTFIQLFIAAPGIWCLALAGLALLFRESKQGRFFIFAFFLFSSAAVYPGWRGHYFIQLFPALGMLAGVAYHAALPFLARLKISLSPQMILRPIFFMAIASPLLQWNDIYFTLTPAQSSRAIYGTNPFPEAVEIGQYIKSHSSPDDRIVVLGSEPEIYFYSHRRAATGFIDTYPLMEPQPFALQMQQQMIHEIESAGPRYAVFVHVPGSWLQFRDSKTLIFDWFGKYHQQLELVGLVEIPANGPSVYRWFEGSQTNVQTSCECWIAIYQRP